jgi:hypothetical protein
VKCHVIPWLQLNPPIVVILLGRTWHEAERRAEPLNFKRLNLDAIILNRTKLCEPLLERTASMLLIQLRSRAQIIDSRFEKAPLLVKEEERNELPACAPTNGRDEWCREKELATV